MQYILVCMSLLFISGEVETKRLLLLQANLVFFMYMFSLMFQSVYIYFEKSQFKMLLCFLGEYQNNFWLSFRSFTISAKRCGVKEACNSSAA